MRISGPWLPLLGLFIVPLQVEAQAVECSLTRSLSGDISGQCQGIREGLVLSIQLRAGTGAEAVWVGTMETNGTVMDIDITSYEYSSGPVEIVRTPFGWFIPSRLSLDTDPPALAWSMSDEAPPSRTDLEIITRARALIPDEWVWDRADDRVCAPSDTTYSLYCALAEATRVVSGEYQHRQPALQIVRRIVVDVWPERIVDHRLMNFNNDPKTTFGDLMRAFDLARERALQSIR